MGDCCVYVGQWNWQHIFDKINSSFENAGINTVLNLVRKYDHSINGAEYSDIPDRVIPSAILESQTVCRYFNERNGKKFDQKIFIDNKIETVVSHYGLLVVPEEYSFTYKLFVDGIDEVNILLNKIYANYNNGIVKYKFDNPYNENEPLYLQINMSIEKAMRVSSDSQFCDIIKVPIKFTGEFVRVLDMPTRAARNDYEIGNYLGIVQGLQCTEKVYKNIDNELKKLNEIQNFKKRTFLMSKEVSTLGSQYVNHKPMDKILFEKNIETLSCFYPNLCDEISAGKRVEGIDELKGKLYNRYKLVYNKAREIYSWTGLSMNCYTILDDISVRMNKYGLDVKNAILETYKSRQEISNLASDLYGSVKRTTVDVSKTAAGVAIGNKISGNTGQGKAQRYHDYKGSSGCLKSHKSIVSCTFQCNLYHDCVWGEGKGKYN